MLIYAYFGIAPVRVKLGHFRPSRLTWKWCIWIEHLPSWSRQPIYGNCVPRELGKARRLRVESEQISVQNHNFIQSRLKPNKNAYRNTTNLVQKITKWVWDNVCILTRSLRFDQSDWRNTGFSLLYLYHVEQKENFHSGSRTLWIDAF